MIRTITLLAITGMLTLAMASTAGAAGVDGDDVVLNVGHRGASGLAPEHTIAAYDLALRLGADYIEQDLQMTSDGVLVAIHDATLDRTAQGPAENCTGFVRDKTLAQIKTCDVGSWFNEAHPEHARPEYVGLQIPTLEEVFRRYRHRTNYYIETKNPAADPGMEEALLELMDKYNLTRSAGDRWQVLIQSFSPESLMKIHGIDPTLPLIQLYGGSFTSAGIQATLAAVSEYAVGIGPSKNDVDTPLVDAAHSHCLDIHPYTVNETAEMETLIALGVDGMFTNFPNRLDDVLGKAAIGGKHAAKLAADAHTDCQAG